MTKIDPSVKAVSITFNIFYAIFGFVLIHGLFQFNAQLSAAGSLTLALVWMFTISVTVVSCLGIYAAWTEKAFFLKIFAGLVSVGMAIVLILYIVVVVQREQAKDSLVSLYLKDENQRAILESKQLFAQCCGVFGASDWGDEIPQSCGCNKQYGYSSGSSSCIDRPLGTTGPSRVWLKGCKDFIFSYQDLGFKSCMCALFGGGVTVLLSLLLTLLMIRQVNRHDGEGSTIESGHTCATGTSVI